MTSPKHPFGELPKKKSMLTVTSRLVAQVKYPARECRDGASLIWRRNYLRPINEKLLRAKWLRRTLSFTLIEGQAAVQFRQFRMIDHLSLTFSLTRAATELTRLFRPVS